MCRLGYFNRGCNIRENSGHPLGGPSIPCGFELERTDESSNICFTQSPILILARNTFDYSMQIFALTFTGLDFLLLSVIENELKRLFKRLCGQRHSQSLSSTLESLLIPGETLFSVDRVRLNNSVSCCTIYYILNKISCF